MKHLMQHMITSAVPRAATIACCAMRQVNVFKDAAVIMCNFVKRIRAEGFDLKYLDIGGGLGIDYAHR